MLILILLRILIRILFLAIISILVLILIPIPRSWPRCTALRWRTVAVAVFVTRAPNFTNPAATCSVTSADSLSKPAAAAIPRRPVPAHTRRLRFAAVASQRCAAGAVEHTEVCAWLCCPCKKAVLAEASWRRAPDKRPCRLRGGINPRSS